MDNGLHRLFKRNIRAKHHEYREATDIIEAVTKQPRHALQPIDCGLPPYLYLQVGLGLIDPFL